MILVNVVLIILLCVGFVFIVIGVLKKETKDNDEFFIEAGQSIKLVKDAVKDADNAVEQLNLLTEDMLNEFDEKYQELIFLYQLIDDMKNLESKDYNSDFYENFNDMKKDNKKYNNTINNPKLKEIIKLREEGKNISEISKSLNIGQGEVKLIMELNKVRWFLCSLKAFLLD